MMAELELLYKESGPPREPFWVGFAKQSGWRLILFPDSKEKKINLYDRKQRDLLHRFPVNDYILRFFATCPSVQHMAYSEKEEDVKFLINALQHTQRLRYPEIKEHLAKRVCPLSEKCGVCRANVGFERACGMSDKP